MGWRNTSKCEHIRALFLCSIAPITNAVAGAFNQITKIASKDDQLFIEATWVNPDNGPQCGGDPDMKVGMKSQSTIGIHNEQLWIELPFGNSVMIYVWDQISLPIR